MKAFSARTTFYVKRGDECSPKLDVTNGFPQRRVLGALLFLFSIDKVVSAQKSSSLFADGLNVIRFTSREDVNGNRGAVLEWIDRLELPINVSKSHVIPRGTENLIVT